MNRQSLIHAYTIFMVLLSLNTVTRADTSKIEFSADAGLEYDRNVNVQELDSTANAADVARRLNANLQGTWAATDKLTVKGGYHHADKAYRELDSFNQTIGTWSADLAYDFSAATLGASYHRADAELDSASFLRLDRRGVYAGRLLGQRVYLRAAYHRQEKSFSDNRGRDADGDGADVDLFFFFNQARGFLSLGIGKSAEGARDSIFDYDALSFRGRWSNRFSVGGKNNQVQLSVRLSERDYAKFNPGIGAKRRDRQRVVEASWELFFNHYWSAIATLERGAYQSNLDSADYDETLASFQLQAKF